MLKRRKVLIGMMSIPLVVPVRPLFADGLLDGLGSVDVDDLGDLGGFGDSGGGLGGGLPKVRSSRV
jgi:hypothetical protein